MVGTRRVRVTSTLTASAVGAAGLLGARVGRLLNAEVDHRRRLAPSVLGLVVLAVAAASVVAHATTPTIVFSDAAGAADASAIQPRLPAIPVVTTVPVALQAPGPPFGERPAAPPTARPARSVTSRAPAPAQETAPAAAAPVALTARPCDLPDVTSAPAALVAVHRVPTQLGPPGLAPVAPMPAPPSESQDTSAWGRAAAVGSGIGTRAARTGAAAGRGVQHAGSSIGTMFGRAARSIADSF